MNGLAHPHLQQKTYEVDERPLQGLGNQQTDESRMAWVFPIIPI